MAINPYDIQGIDSYALDDDLSTSLLPEEQQEKLKGNVGVPVFFGNVQTPEQNEFIDNVLALPRGFGKSAARMVAAEIPEGLFALADLTTNLTGFQDALDPKESAFLDKLQEVRDTIGYEESVPGKLGEALGSMAAFVGTTFLTGGAAALTGIPKVAQAARLFQTGKIIKAAKASPATFAFMSSPGYMFSSGEQQLRMKARERAGQDIEIGDRNLALALSIPVGISEFIPIGRIFGAMKRSDVSPEEFFAYQEILKRGFRSAGEEGLQEAGAGVLQDLIERGVYNPDAAIGETWASEFGYGAGAGAVFSLALNIANRKSALHRKTITENNPDGDPDVLVKGLPDDQLSEVAKEENLENVAKQENENEFDAFLAGKEVKLKSDLSEPEAVIEQPETPVDRQKIPIVDESGLLDDTNIPEDLKVGDKLFVFDPKGNRVEVEVEAISNAGSIRVVLPEGEIGDPESDDPSKVILNSGRFGTINSRNPNYVIQSTGLPAEFRQGKKINELNDEEINQAYAFFKEKVDDVKLQGIDLETPSGQSSQAAYRLLMSDLSAIEFEINRRKEIAKDTLGEVIKAVDEQEEVTETTTEAAEAAPEVTVEEQIEEETKTKKAKPAKRINLNQKITNPVNKKSVDVGFADEESARVYGDGQIQTKRLVDKKTKKVINESQAFRKNVQNNLGIGTQQYKELNTRYTNRVKKEAEEAMNNNEPVFTPISFADFVNEEIGVPTQEDIIQNLKDKNISTTDGDFKKYLSQQWRVDSLEDLNALNRRELMRTMSSLPMMDQKNTSISKAFGIQGDNLKIVTRQTAIDDQAKKLKNKYTLQELITLAKSSGIPDQQIYSQREGKPFTTSELAQTIATKEIDLLTSAEEMRDRIASVVVPNVAVRKNKLSKKDTADGVIRYNVEFPDKSKVRVPVDNRVEESQARELAAQLSLQERVKQLKEENEKKKTVPQASDRDYLEAVRYMLVSGNNPLAILQQIAKPKFSQVKTREQRDIAIPSVEDIAKSPYALKDSVDEVAMLMQLSRLSKKMFKDANVGVVDRLFNPETRKEVAGVTDISAEDLILISVDNKFADPTNTLYHEAFHWFSNNGFFSNEDLAGLREDEARIRNIADGVMGQRVESFEEAAAIASGVYNEAKLNGEIPYQHLPRMRRVFDKLYRFFNQFKQFLTRKKYRTAEEIFDRMREGELFKEMKDNQVPLTKVNNNFVLENFKDFGQAGKYEGGRLIQETVDEYTNIQGARPFWVNSNFDQTPKNYQFSAMDLRLFQNNALLDRINDLRLKQAKGKEWINQIYSKKRPIKEAYKKDSNLEEWLEDNFDKTLTKEQVINHYNHNSDIYTVEIEGPDIDFLPFETNDERLAYDQITKEVSQLSALLQQNLDELKLVGVQNSVFYRALKEEFNDGPNTSLESAFFGAVQTDKVINAWKKESKNAPFPLETKDKDFDHLRKAFNSDVAPYDFMTDPKNQTKTEEILAKMIEPFVVEKRVDDFLTLRVTPRYMKDIKDEDLQKFFADIFNSSKVSVNPDGKVKVTMLSIQSDGIEELVNKFRNAWTIENFVKENGFTEETNHNGIHRLLRTNFYLRQKLLNYRNIQENPNILADPASAEITYINLKRFEDPRYGDMPQTAIPFIDPVFTTLQRFAIRGAALAKGEDITRRKYKRTKELKGLIEESDNYYEGRPDVVSVKDMPLISTQGVLAFDEMVNDPDQINPDFIKMDKKDFLLSFNNLETNNYRVIKFGHRPRDQSQQLYVNNAHFQSFPGMWGHARIRDIFLPDGKRFLFVEEIQSDYLNDLKQALKPIARDKSWQESLKQKRKVKIEVKDLNAEDIQKAFKDGLKVSVQRGGKEIVKNLQQIPLLMKADGTPDFTNSYQDFMVNMIRKLAIDNHYDGISVINESLQAERIMESVSDSFDNLYFLSSVNPNDVALEETSFLHKPSGQRISLEELESSEFFTAVDSFADNSGRMAAANLFARKFSQNPDSYEHQKYVNFVRLIGMQRANVAQDLTVSIGLPIDNPVDVIRHEATEFGTNTTENVFSNYFQENQFDEENKLKSLGSFLPPNFVKIIEDQVNLGVLPDPLAQRNNISVLKPTEVFEETEELISGDVSKPFGKRVSFDPNRIMDRQNMLQGIGNGYFNIRSMSPELIRLLGSKQGFTQYGNTLFRRFNKSIRSVSKDGWKVAGKSQNQIFKDLYDGATVSDVNNKNWWSNKLFESEYDELSDVDKNVVDMQQLEAQMRGEAEFGIKPAAREYKGSVNEVQGNRFRFPTIEFEEGFTEKYGTQKGGNAYGKFSSVPADAQKAHTTVGTLEKGRNLTKYFSGLGSLPNYLKYMKERYLTFGRMAEAEDAAKFLYNEIGAIVNPSKGKDSKEKQQLRRELTEYMEGGFNAKPEIISNVKLRKLAIKAKTMIDNVGRLLVNKGLLPRDVYEKNRGAYLPRLYMKHILNSPNGNPLSYTRKRKDLDTETRVMLGDIADISPEFRIYAGITRPLRDIAMLDFFETVSDQQGWAIKDNDIMVQVPTPDGKVMNVSALWLREESDRLREQARFFQNSEPESALQMNEKADEFEALAQPALERTGNADDANVPQGFRRIPKTKRYGMLQGVAVRKEIYNDIIGTFTIGDTDNFYNKAIAAMKKGVNIWKTLKVPLNPPTVVRNVGSNMILMNVVGGVPIHKVLPRMKQAIDQIRNDGAAWKVAKKYGIKSTGFSEQELYQTSEAMLDLMQEQHELGDITKFFALPKIIGQRILKKGGDLYQFTESVGKTAIIIDAMDRGMGEFESFMLSQKALFDYSDLPAGGKAFRSAPIGMPFFTFYYKAFPALVEVALTNPMRFAPYVALSAGLSALSGFAFGFDDDEDKKLKKSLEPWIERRTGVHVLPFKDSDGRFQFIDIGFFFPWTMYADAAKAAYNGEFMELQRTTGLFSGPFSDILLAIKTNRDPFTQRVIWDERDPVEERVKNMMWYTYSLGMPSWLTPNGAISKTVRALQDTPRPTGQPSDTVPQALLRFVGVNLYGLEPRETRQRNIKRMRQDIEDVRSRMRWTMRNQSLDQETKNARRKRYLALIREKQEMMAQYMHDTSLPDNLLNRKSRFQK
jgi:hypothetical protein